MRWEPDRWGHCVLRGLSRLPLKKSKAKKKKKKKKAIQLLYRNDKPQLPSGGPPAISVTMRLLRVPGPRTGATCCLGFTCALSQGSVETSVLIAYTLLLYPRIKVTAGTSG